MLVHLYTNDTNVGKSSKPTILVIQKAATVNDGKVGSKNLVQDRHDDPRFMIGKNRDCGGVYRGGLDVITGVCLVRMVRVVSNHKCHPYISHSRVQTRPLSCSDWQMHTYMSSSHTYILHYRAPRAQTICPTPMPDYTIILVCLEVGVGVW